MAEYRNGVDQASADTHRAFLLLPYPHPALAPAPGCFKQTGEYSVNLLLWHKHLLYHEEHTSIKDRISSITSSMKGLLKGKH
jgi:hypothetical protein